MAQTVPDTRHARSWYDFIGHSSLALAASFGATVTCLPPRFWTAPHFNPVFWPLASNLIPGPILTLSVMLVACSALANALGSVEPARLYASAAINSASNVYT